MIVAPRRGKRREQAPAGGPGWAGWPAARACRPLGQARVRPHPEERCKSSTARTGAGARGSAHWPARGPRRRRPPRNRARRGRPPYRAHVWVAAAPGGAAGWRLCGGGRSRPRLRPTAGVSRLAWRPGHLRCLTAFSRRLARVTVCHLLDRFGNPLTFEHAGSLGNRSFRRCGPLSAASLITTSAGGVRSRLPLGVPATPSPQAPGFASFWGLSSLPPAPSVPKWARNRFVWTVLGVRGAVTDPPTARGPSMRTRKG